MFFDHIPSSVVSLRHRSIITKDLDSALTSQLLASIGCGQLPGVIQRLVLGLL